MEKLKNNEENNKIQLGLINSGLRDFKEEIEDMSEQEKNLENPNEVVGLLYFLYRSKKFTKQLYKNEVDII